ncbi:MAG: MFS transporter, partial [Candidatus Jordarchaeaceae archaeon]
MKLKAVATTSPREVLWIAFLCLFIDSISYEILVPSLSNYALSLGATNFDLALIFAAFAIAELLTAIPFGLFSDRYGRKHFMMGGMFLLTLSLLCYPLSKSVLMLIVCRTA